MKSLLNLSLIYFVCLLMPACTDYTYQDKTKKETNMDFNQEEYKETSSATIFDLTDEEIKIHQQQASNGDIESALKLTDYYSFSDYNNEEAVKWYEQAIKNGDINSMRNVSIIYSVMEKYQEALFWAEKYKESSIEEANKLIQDCLMCLTKQCPTTAVCQQKETISSTPLLTSENQIEMNKQQALKKNLSSAWTLFHHYISVNNHKEAEKWLKLAAEIGSTEAMQKIACIYYSQNRFKEALFWAEKYKESLEQEANESIQNLKRKMSEE